VYKTVQVLLGMLYLGNIANMLFVTFESKEGVIRMRTFCCEVVSAAIYVGGEQKCMYTGVYMCLCMVLSQYTYTFVSTSCPDKDPRGRQSDIGMSLFCPLASGTSSPRESRDSLPLAAHLLENPCSRSKKSKSIFVCTVTRERRCFVLLLWRC
jgi:hypothetical protein